MKKKRIAFICPITKPAYPKTTASRPRVIYEILKNLYKKKEYQITLFGTKDFKLPCDRLIYVADKVISKMPPVENEFYRLTGYLSLLVNEVYKHHKEFDIIHNHLYPEFLPLLLSKFISTPILTTIHTQLTSHLYKSLLGLSNKNCYFAALSKAQKRLGPKLNWLGVVYNGIDISHFKFNPKPKDYFLWVGRIKFYRDKNGNVVDPKGVLSAIKVAKKANIKLLISGSIENFDDFEKLVKPHLGKNIKFIGKPSSSPPLSYNKIVYYYQNAKALLFPIHWEEAFGLVMAEAMSCGTPVIAFDRGSTSEVVKHKKTGFVVKDEKEMVKAIKEIDLIKREDCRKWVEENFTSEKMTENYEKLYSEIIDRKK